MDIGDIYHITTKSIAGYVVFNNNEEYLRFKNLVRYYKVEKPRVRFSYFEAWQLENNNISEIHKYIDNACEDIVKVIAYCFMPTHIHLILQQLKDGGVSIYMSKILNGYTRYFNEKHKRKGPLWTGRFKRIKIDSDDQLLHLTRYIHLNPVTAYLVDKPDAWEFSSYPEYVQESCDKDKICDFNELLEPGSDYKMFVADRISYQRELAKIKDLLIED